jgi:Ser/Thr protein kinase RdoA (MazF antagonist)
MTPSEDSGPGCTAEDFRALAAEVARGAFGYVAGVTQGPPADPGDDIRERFFALTPERVLDAVETVGRRSTGFALALGSLENRVYEVELEDGERVVAKFYRPGRWPVGAIREEHAFLVELAEAEVPVAAPLPLGDSGDTLGALDVGAADGAIAFAVFPKLRGRPPEDLDDERCEWLGRLIARLHLVGAARPARERGRLDPESYGAVSLRALEAAGVVPDAVAQRYFDVGARVVDGCRIAFARAGGGPFPGDDIRDIRIHGDCHPGNLLWGSAGPFFLDFDDFLMGPPAQDLWLLAPGHDDHALAARAAIVRGYRTLRDFDERTLALVEPLRALRILRYAAWIANRWRDPSFPRAFPHFLEPQFWQREIQALDEQRARIEQAAT